MSMVGDAISHAVLPGIVIAFLISGTNEPSLIMLSGAVLVGVFCTFLIEIFTKKAGVQGDAAIGLAFTFLFAIGVILIAAFAENVHLDQDCVLHGEMITIPLILADTGTFLDYIPVPLWSLTALFFAVVAFVLIGYKGLYLTTFDSEYADSIGVPTNTWHYMLMAAVSATTVIAFESVGAVLVIAFLVAPPATAYLLTNKLNTMLLLACGFGILSAITGYYLAVILDGSVAGAMSAMMGVWFIIAFVMSKKGLVLG
ncbi:UNVERIFIED_CONTAM: hypothetical protein GTU68_031889 [Idotea baltica]|nr:hypothetical protein [Idotea baltica]